MTHLSSHLILFTSACSMRDWTDLTVTMCWAMAISHKA